MWPRLESARFSRVVEEVRRSECDKYKYPGGPVITPAEAQEEAQVADLVAALRVSIEAAKERQRQRTNGSIPMTQMTQLLQWALDDLSYVKPNGPPDQLTAAGGLYGPPVRDHYCVDPGIGASDVNRCVERSSKREMSRRLLPSRRCPGDR